MGRSVLSYLAVAAVGFGQMAPKAGGPLGVPSSGAMVEGSVSISSGQPHTPRPHPRDDCWCRWEPANLCGDLGPARGIPQWIQAASAGPRRQRQRRRKFSACGTGSGHLLSQSYPRCETAGSRGRGGLDEIGAKMGRKVYAVFPNSREDVVRFESRSHLLVRSAAGLELGRFGVRVTPTAVLVGRNGQVLGSWVGSSRATEGDIEFAFAPPWWAFWMR